MRGDPPPGIARPRLVPRKWNPTEPDRLLVAGHHQPEATAL